MSLRTIHIFSTVGQYKDFRPHCFVGGHCGVVPMYLEGEGQGCRLKRLVENKPPQSIFIVREKRPAPKKSLHLPNWRRLPLLLSNQAFGNRLFRAKRLRQATAA